MAQSMTTVMTQSNSSILYSLTSFDHSAVYVGRRFVQERPGIARMPEHRTATSDTSPAEMKYKGLRAAGGDAAWYVVPFAGDNALVRG